MLLGKLGQRQKVRRKTAAPINFRQQGDVLFSLTAQYWEKSFNHARVLD
jgi:hypothetical protein